MREEQRQNSHKLKQTASVFKQKGRRHVSTPSERESWAKESASLFLLFSCIELGDFAPHDKVEAALPPAATTALASLFLLVRHKSSRVFLFLHTVSSIASKRKDADVNLGRFMIINERERRRRESNECKKKKKKKNLTQEVYVSPQTKSRDTNIDNIFDAFIYDDVSSSRKTWMWGEKRPLKSPPSSSHDINIFSSITEV